MKLTCQRTTGVGPVTQVLKRFLSAHGLNDPYTGGMPAYGIVLIVTAIALQLREQHRREQLLGSNSNVSSRQGMNRDSGPHPQKMEQIACRPHGNTVGHAAAQRGTMSDDDVCP